MIRFREALKQQALDTLSAYSTRDEIDARQDIDQIDYALNKLTYDNSFEFLQTVASFDHHIRSKYPAIDNLQNIANEMGRLSPNNGSGVFNAADDLGHRLRMDERGILATVLMKHHLIEKLKDTLEDIPAQTNPSCEG